MTQLTVSTSGSLGVKNTSPQFDVHVIGTTDPASITVDGIGIVGPNFQFRRARGTASSPSAVMSGDGILFLVGKGYGATGFSSAGRANLSMYAAHDWSDTAQGTYISLKTTASGTTSQTEKMRITDTGNILPPSDDSGSIGMNGQRWSLVRAVTITSGDLIFENGYRFREAKNSGVLLLNDEGEAIAKFDREGNLHIKGDVIKDL